MPKNKQDGLRHSSGDDLIFPNPPRVFVNATPSYRY